MRLSCLFQLIHRPADRESGAHLQGTERVLLLKHAWRAECSTVALTNRRTCPVIIQKETFETKVSASSPHTWQGFCCYSVIIRDTGGRTRTESNVLLTRCCREPEMTTERMQRPQWRLLTAAGSTVCLRLCSLSFPYVSTPPSHPVPQHRKSHGWLYTGNSAQKFGPRILNQPSAVCEGVKIDPFSTPS